MSQISLQVPLDLVPADYNIYRFTDQIYKVVKFKRSAPFIGFINRDCKSYDFKLDSSLSRTRRVVLELALCNPWKYFCTFTLDSTKQDRNDLSKWHKQFTQWLRDQRKKYLKKGLDLKFDYLLIPEQHQDGSWHMHGFFSDISPVLVSFEYQYLAGKNIKYDLVKNGYYNWPDYEKRFGFCSLGLIRSPHAAAFYAVKYITKDLSDSCISVNLNLYYYSQGLNRAEFHGDVYGQCSYLDSFLTNHYEFCSTGMTSLKDNLNWTFGLEYMDVQNMEAFKVSVEEVPPDVSNYYETVQEVMEGF